MTRIQAFYLLDTRRPNRKIRHCDCFIFEGPKMLWADDGKHRHLIGSSAFQTLHGAEQKKLYLLKRLMFPGARSVIGPYSYDYAYEQILRYQQTGSFERTKPQGQ